MQYKEFTLDPFQVDAITSLEKNHSVVVSAATGTGKTLIADYVITKYLKEGKRIIYTAPIKALSNQKFRDFTNDFGKDKVGLITGDVQYNQGGQVLIMTTEIYRNMLLSHDPIVDEVAYVIFDEIHYISDRERGTIWEESVIFSPEHIRFLCLSATIPNAEQFGEWIQTIKHHNVDIVRYAKRAVPLTHFFYDEEGFGLMTRDELHQAKDSAKAPRYDSRRNRRGRGKYNKRDENRNRLNHTTLIKDLQEKGWMPCLFFIFSRSLCHKKAQLLAKKNDYLPAEKKPRVQEIFRKTIPEEQTQMESTKQIKELALKGIGIHHAGLLPKIKEFIELCFAEGLLQVLFATETFAVGINMPARCVCFLSLEKYDGYGFRYLNSKEYFQLAGRAGRRGIDKEGYAISMLQMSKAEIDRILRFTESDKDPIKSQFELSYNTALYLFSNHTYEETETILKNSFDFFQKKSQGSHLRIMASYKNRLKMLRKLGYINDNGLTERGKILQNLYAHELMIGEVFTTDIVTQMNPIEIALYLAALELEERKGVQFVIDRKNPYPDRVLKKVTQSPFVAKNLKKFDLKRLAAMITNWMKDNDFEAIMEMTTMQEGDIIHLFRRILDSLRQIHHAVKNTEVEIKVEQCMEMIDKSPVRFEL